jgi:hypothetical protein
VHAHAAVARRNDGGVIEIRLYGIDRLLVGIDRSDDLIRPDLQLGRPAAGCQKPSRQVRDRWSLSSRKQVGHRLSSFGPSPAHRRHSGDGRSSGMSVRPIVDKVATTPAPIHCRPRPPTPARMGPLFLSRSARRQAPSSSPVAARARSTTSAPSSPMGPMLRTCRWSRAPLGGRVAPARSLWWAARRPPEWEGASSRSWAGLAVGIDSTTVRPQYPINRCAADFEGLGDVERPHALRLQFAHP